MNITQIGEAIHQSNHPHRIEIRWARKTANRRRSQKEKHMKKDLKVQRAVTTELAWEPSLPGRRASSRRTSGSRICRTEPSSGFCTMAASMPGEGLPMDPGRMFIEVSDHDPAGFRLPSIVVEGYSKCSTAPQNCLGIQRLSDARRKRSECSFIIAEMICSGLHQHSDRGRARIPDRKLTQPQYIA